MSEYAHLGRCESDRAAEMKAAGRSVGAIARALGRAASTIGLELGRNALEGGFAANRDGVSEIDANQGPGMSSDTLTRMSTTELVADLGAALEM